MKRVVGFSLGAIVLAMVLGVGGVLFGLYHYGRDLPDYRQLADYEPPVATRVHAADGSLLAEYARQKRLFVPISAIPKQVIHAFLAAEDKNFYSHGGIDFLGVTRAVLVNLRNMVSSRRLVGASTITQQVAKNFLLTNEVSYQRKIKEAILAFRIERAFTKDQILELYLNEIYLGGGSYGVAAAALNYFNRSLDELDLAETAFLAALPKAPNNYNPVRHPEAALARRNWVLGRLLEEGYITPAERDAARAEPLTVRQRDTTRMVAAVYFNEEVRRRLYDLYGEKTLYEGGLSVRTSLDPRLQAIGLEVLRKGVIAYDRRHGWRGPEGHLALDNGNDWRARLAALKRPLGDPGWRLAVVLAVDGQGARIALKDGSEGFVPFKEMLWARPTLKKQRVGPPPGEPSDVVRRGDVVIVERLDHQAGGLDRFALRQRPDINGALVAMDPHTGRVLALIGGFDFGASQFNRATQALRQPGSAFKPFVYAAALDAGFTPSSLVLDAPFVIDQGYGMGKWKPANYSNKFYGPSTLRLGIEKSRNLMTVRLAQYIGMDRVVDYARRFGIVDDMPPILSMALGAGETTLLRLTTAYSMLVNGGKHITPVLIDRIQDRRGKTIFRDDHRRCDQCNGVAWHGQPPPPLVDDRAQVIDPATAYQVVSMLQGVVERGTGRRIRTVGKPLAGKTGTTNESFDAWFIGFSPDLAVGVYLAFDTPRTLGPREQAATVAAPVFRDFMKRALAGKPAVPFRIPPGIRLVRVNAQTGLPAAPGDRNVIFEAFKPGTEPRGHQLVLDGSNEVVQTNDTAVQSGTGTIY